MRFERVVETDEERDLRAEVREFLAAQLPPGSYTPGLGLGAAHDRDFSRKLAERGWVGMALPTEYGGHARTAFERFVVVEELLRVGAPVGAHWTADRQTGQTILAFGTEDQKRRFLPAIARGECSFSIGMSEPDAGSDLAAVRTMATRAQDGWLVNGTKIWTSGASHNDWLLMLCRTSPLGEDRHEGLSQLLVDLTSDGITTNTIVTLDGTAEFAEVVFEDVFVPDDLVLGQIGMGWQQVNSELAYERSGPDRYMSTYGVLEHFVREHVGTEPSDRVAEALGRLASRYWALRQLSMSVARSVDEGAAPAVEAALVKEMSTRFEQEVLEEVRMLVDHEPDPGANSLFASLYARATLSAPSFTIRGGTNEILRTVASRGLSGR